MNNGGTVITILKINKDGDIIWKDIVGGSEDETVRCLTNTEDGGFVITGCSMSDDGDFKGLSIGNQDEKRDIFVVKYNSQGKIEWKNILGGTNYDEGFFTDFINNVKKLINRLVGNVKNTSDDMDDLILIIKKLFPKKKHRVIVPSEKKKPNGRETIGFFDLS